MTNVVKAFEPNISKLAGELQSWWFDAEEMRKIIERIAAMYGSETLKEVFDQALGSAAYNAGVAEAEFEGLKAVLAEYGFSMRDVQ
jgi:hypothetical protein